MNFNLFGVVFVLAWLAQLYTTEEKIDLDEKSGNKLEIEKTSPIEDHKSLQAFQYFVYPKKYSNSMFNKKLPSRNITLDKISYQPVDEDASTTDNPNLFRIIDDQVDYRQNVPNNYYNYDGYQQQQGFQPHFLNQGGGNSMIHLVDPLFLMATLAFVVFLVNSVLGLVNKLNLPILGGSKRNQPFNEPFEDGERDRMNEEILDEIENIIRRALYEFKKNV